MPGPVLNSVPFAVVEKAPIAGGTGGAGVNIVRPDVSRMVLYDPRQGFGKRPLKLPFKSAFKSALLSAKYPLFPLRGLFY
jgi:hypothetical protein